MALRILFRPTGLRHAAERKRCTAAAAAPVVAPAQCPFGFRRKVEKAPKKLEGALKPYRAIPAAKGLPILGTTLDIIKSGGASKMHEYCDMRHKQLGPIFKEKLGPVEAVVVADKELISSVYNLEEQYPLHMVPEPWLIYNKKKGIERGLFFMDGPQWLQKRKILNHALLSPQEVTKYGTYVAGIVEDLIKRWNMLTPDNKGIVPNLETELYNWSIETLGTIVFGRRLNIVALPGQTSEMQNFVYYVQKIFGESAKMTLLSPQLAATLKLPVWRRFEDAADNAIRLARECTEQRISELRNVSELRDHGVIGRLLAEKNVSREEIVNIVADLIIAAADTTSHATQWALYSLAKNPECQETLLAQINKAVPPGQTLSVEHLDKIPYLLWIVRETLRLYPIAPFLTRQFTVDIPLNGYRIPAKTLILMSQYTMGRNSQYFNEPNKFRPERWLRTTKGEHQNLANGCMPFGTGARSCIGKRIAEQKMRMLIAKTVQKFKLHATNDVDLAMRMITTPDKPIQLYLEERNK